MFYFKFGIPQNPDGSPVRYSPNWCGERSRCAKNERGLLYNDKELWGIGQAEGDYIPNDVTVISKEDTIKLIASLFNTSPNEMDITDDARVIFRVPVDDIEGIYAGERLMHRWDNKPTFYCKDLIIDFNGKTFPKPLKYSNDLKRSDSKLHALPKYLVKNLKIEYLEQFRNTGEVLVRSIASFRTMGGYGQEEKEGIKNTDICIDVGGPKEFKATELGRFISTFKLEGTGSMEINGKLIIKDKTILPDAYVFCASYKTINEFGGANYKIVSISRFAQTLFESIHKVDKEVYYWMMAPVIYGGAKDPIETLEELKNLGNYNVNIATMLDCFYKPSSHQDEEEFRFVFFTKKKSIEQKMAIHNKNLIKCCSFTD